MVERNIVNSNIYKSKIPFLIEMGFLYFKKNLNYPKAALLKPVTVTPTVLA